MLWILAVLAGLFTQASAQVQDSVLWRCDFDDRVRALSKEAQEYTSVEYGPGKRYAYRLLKGHVVKWETNPWPAVNYTAWRFEGDCWTEAKGPVISAFKTWQRASKRTLARVDDLSSSKFPEDDGKNVVYTHRVWPKAGTTRVQANDENGFIVEVDIALDPKLLNTKDEELVYLLALHEIGHLMGLCHVPHKDALMYPTISMEDIGKKRIGEMAMEGIAFLYPELFGDQLLVWADFDRNRRIDFADFILFGRSYRSTERRADYDDNGIVDFFDFINFTKAYGKEF